VHEADNLTTFMCRMSWKSGSLNLLEPSGAQHRVFVELFLLLTAIMSELFQLTHDSGKKQRKLDKYPMQCIQF